MKFSILQLRQQSYRLTKMLLKFALQLAIVVAIYEVGVYLSQFVPIPANILGMLLLLGLLLSGVLKSHYIHEACAFLLKYMAIFFLPAAVALMGVVGVLKEAWLGFIAVCVLTTIIVFIATAITVASVSRYLTKVNKT